MCFINIILADPCKILFKYYYRLFTGRSRKDNDLSKVTELLIGGLEIQSHVWLTSKILILISDPCILPFLIPGLLVPLSRTHLVLPSPSCPFYPTDLTCSSALFNVPFYTVISQFPILLHFPLDSRLCDSRDQIYLVLSDLFKTMTHTF